MSLSHPSPRFPLARLTQAAAAILALFLLAVPSARADPASMPIPPACKVGGASPSHASIQQAVDDPDCDTVVVAAGTYYENVVISRSVKVSGSGSENGATPTIVDGSDAGRVFKMDSTTSPAGIVVTVTGLVIQNGEGLIDGPGVFVDTFSDVTLKNVTVRNNYGNNGGGIYSKGQLTVVASTVRSNIANDGGGIKSQAASISSRLDLVNTIVTDNTAAFSGGGLWISGSAGISGSAIDGNTADIDGGALYAYGASTDIRVENSTFDGNISVKTGGVAVSSAQMTFENSSISNNQGATLPAPPFVDVKGMGLHIYPSSTVTMTNSTVSGNVWVTVGANSVIRGGGVYVAQGSSLLLRGSTVSWNDTNGIEAGRDQGILKSVVVLEDVDVLNNAREGVLGDNQYSDITISDSRIANNGTDGVHGRELTILRSLIADNGGTGIYNALLTATIDYSIIRDNGDGGIWTPFLVMDRSTVSGNTKTGDGGGIFTGGLTTIRTSAVYSNTATGDGGGLHASAGVVTIESSTFSGNAADDYGGGAFFDPTVSGTVLASTFSNNTSDDDASDVGGGGGVYHDDTTGNIVTVTSSIIAGNYDLSPIIKAPDCQGGFNSGNNNLVGVINGCSGDFNLWNDLTGTLASPLDAKLGPLADNGGPTLTHELLTGSPAIDTGLNANCQPADQRGAARPYPGSGSYDCDKGAFEVAVCGLPGTPSTSYGQNGAAFNFSWQPGANTAGFEVRRGQDPYSTAAYSSWRNLPADVTDVTDYRVLHDVVINDFFSVRAFNACGDASADSDVRGEFSYPLQPVTGGTPHFAAFAIPLTGDVITWDTDQMAAIIDPRGSVQRMAHYLPLTGSWDVTFINLDPLPMINESDVWIVDFNDKAPFSFGIAGTPIAFGWHSNALFDNMWNDIIIPLDQAGNFPMTSAGLAADIGGVTKVAAWNLAAQSWDIWQTGDTPFPVAPGYPYAVYTTTSSPPSWP